jgi:hypothetical protein
MGLYQTKKLHSKRNNIVKRQPTDGKICTKYTSERDYHPEYTKNSKTQYQNNNLI